MNQHDLLFFPFPADNPVIGSGCDLVDQHIKQAKDTKTSKTNLYQEDAVINSKNQQNFFYHRKCKA